MCVCVCVCVRKRGGVSELKVTSHRYTGFHKAVQLFD